MERKHLEHRVRGTWVQCSQLLMSSLISEMSLSLCLLTCTGDRSRQLPGSSCHQLGHSEALRGGPDLWIIHRCGLTIEKTHRLAPEILTPHFLLWSRDPQYLSEVDLRRVFSGAWGRMAWLWSRDHHKQQWSHLFCVWREDPSPGRQQSLCVCPTEYWPNPKHDQVCPCNYQQNQWWKRATLSISQYSTDAQPPGITSQPREVDGTYCPLTPPPR